MQLPLAELCELFRRSGPVVRVTVIAVEGSTPREVGAVMTVSVQTVTGTVGGGALEYDAIAHARQLVETDAMWLRDTKNYPLGPRLGQCCGGQVRLLFERYRADEIDIVSSFADAKKGYFVRPVVSGSAPVHVVDVAGLSAAPGFVRKQFQTLTAHSDGRCKLASGAGQDESWFLEPLSIKRLPIYLYGAGHVGREVVRVFEGLAVEIVWIDTDAERFPDPVPAHVKRLVIASPNDAVGLAPEDAFHVVMSYSHALDLEICHAVLKRGRFRYLGLIGSMTKRARFLKRLGDLGVSEAELSRLTCPLGAGGPRSKEPGVIAISLAAEILQLSETAPR
ncbi:Xanthine and CO dehydrogenases maturation factor, XdhC/CoxF family [hydrothermal vent metagenome]|uniref:Xanthine and CO dehydrogenases maturation factor, XdhC/CoxF family n=1 Tax=hydrothermal vent metagenome TaxID=652676 RepID=A0A3B0RCA4_9ZZZZ